MLEYFPGESALEVSFVADMCSGWVSRCTVHGCSLEVGRTRPSAVPAFYLTYSREIREAGRANGGESSLPPPE